MPLFHFSITWIVGDGRTTSYWRDPWSGVSLILLLENGDRPIHPFLSLRDAYPIRHQLHTAEVQTNDIIFTGDRDEVQWNWMANKVYSASSIYEIRMGGGQIKSPHSAIWKLPIPPTVRIFAYLMLKRKILTQDVMQTRNMGTNDGCHMCQNCPSESALHLLFLCPVAIQVWCEVSANLGYRLMAPAQSLTDIWVSSRDNVRRLGDHYYREWQAFFMCACWHMWKRRNEKIFSGTTTPTRSLAERIIQDGRLWLKYCNTGARRLMGTNLMADPD